MTDPGYSFFHPDVNMFDPGPEDRMGNMMKLVRALDHRCDDACQVCSRIPVHCRAPASVIPGKYCTAGRACQSACTAAAVVCRIRLAYQVQPHCSAAVVHLPMFMPWFSLQKPLVLEGNMQSCKCCWLHAAAAVDLCSSCCLWS